MREDTWSEAGEISAGALVKDRDRAGVWFNRRRVASLDVIEMLDRNSKGFATRP